MKSNEVSEFDQEVRDELLRFAHRLCKNETEAQDLVQNTFFIMLNQLAEIRRETARAYAFKVVHNLFINSLRTTNKQEVTAEYIEQIPDKSNSVTVNDLSGNLERASIREKTTNSVELLLRIRKRIQDDPNLSDSKKLVLELRVRHRMKTSEIAFILERSERMIRYDLEAIREYLNKLYSS